MTNIKEPVKGFRDYTGLEALKRQETQRIVEDIFRSYGFEPAETPIIEDEEFVRGDNPSDEAVSDTYKLTDKGKRKLALRYEFTFQLKRIAQGKKLPYRRYQIGPVFRDEPVAENRTRQFTTCEVDIIDSNIKSDAEILSVANQITKKLNLGEVNIYFNNRKLIDEILSGEGIKEEDRKQVIREIDKLDKLTDEEVTKNLKKFGAESLIKIFSKPESYFEKYKNYSEIKEVKEYCKQFGFEVQFLPSLARGLSYYTGTIFEIKSKVMKQTILGGGRYIIGNIEGIGFGTSIERLSVLAEIPLPKTQYLVVSLNQDEKTIEITKKLRSQGKSCVIFYGKPSKALEYANSYSINKAVFIGEKEIKEKKFTIKDLTSGKEEKVGEKELLE
ncbi:MAG: ATP phosphoribosyltransferase regulatory subunit [Nanoarchaeota archaeon]